VCMSVCVCVSECGCVWVFLYYISLLSSQHAPLHCVILHASFVLFTFYVVIFCVLFLIKLLSLDICSLIHV